MLYGFLLRPILFLFPAEKAHHFAMGMLKVTLSIPLLSHLVRRSFSRANQSGKPVELMGLQFSNRVGLAAGFDKDGKEFRALSHLGFGFLELGTVTPRPQAGNPKPRLFRLPSDRAVINRMGFNNEGVEALCNRLKRGRPKGVVIGGNIGKNKDTPNEKAVDDYLFCMEALHPWVDYFTVNMSSPNTPNLRELQDKEPLRKILGQLMKFNEKTGAPKPVLLKIAPDLSEGQLDDIVEIVSELKLAGVVATNTTISRDGLSTPGSRIESIGSGGLSGAPLSNRSPRIVNYCREKLGPDFAIIGVGGIMEPTDAVKMLRAGADLVQLYTGIIYTGPGLVPASIDAIKKAEI
jgi:dihydroorotate dehydrogenase